MYHASSWVPDLENGVLFGAFVTVTRSWRSGGHHDSAVCAFLLEDIEREFNGTGSFYELTQAGNYTLSQPLPPSQVPSPRPGVACPSGPRTLSATDTRFWEQHPLITRAPAMRHGRIFFALSGVAFRSLVAFVLHQTWGSWVICYVATEQGTVLKLAEEILASGQTPAPALLVDTFNATTEPIHKMLASLEVRPSTFCLNDTDERISAVDAEAQRLLHSSPEIARTISSYQLGSSRDSL
ncbi:semaphorin-2A-like [Amblyomma americanum]